MKPVAESSKAADTERFEAAVGVWKPTGQRKGPVISDQPEEKEVTMKHQPTTGHPSSDTGGF